MNFTLNKLNIFTYVNEAGVDVVASWLSISCG